MPRRCHALAAVGGHDSARPSRRLAWLPAFASMMLASIAVLAPAQAPPAHATRVHPPLAARKPVAAEHHGIHRSDDYAWLRTARLEQVLWRPEALEKPIKAHLETEN